jgi:hypothetical protein
MNRLSVLVFAGLGCAAFGGTTTWSPSPADLNDLDHHMEYTWRISSGIPSLTGQVITSAKITIANIANWTTGPNQLFIHLLDTAKTSPSGSNVAQLSSSVFSWVDDASDGETAIADNFAGALYATNPLVTSSTANTLLDAPIFTAVPTNYTFNFNSSQLNALQTYIGNGNDFAFGIDPDCHFFNDGIAFSMTTTAAVPEPASVLLLVTLVGLLLLRLRRSSQELPTA